MVKKAFNWRLFILLVGANLIGYILSLWAMPSLRLLVQTAGLWALAVGVGLYLAKDLGLNFLWEQDKGERLPGLAEALALGALLAVVTLASRAAMAAALYAELDVFAYIRVVRMIYAEAGGQELVKELAAALSRETLDRLLVMSAVVGLAKVLAPKWPSPTHFWAGIMVAAGYGRVAALAAILSWPLASEALITSGLVIINVVPAVVFGWLFWKRGWEAALVCHGAMVLLRIGLVLAS